MPLPPLDFSFGRDAIVPQGAQEQFDLRRDSLLAEAQPANLLEALVTEELIHASWELERTRNIGEATPAALQFQNRASRNWRRARKALAGLQSARGAAATRLPAHAKGLFEQTPFANPAGVPAEGACVNAIEWEARRLDAWRKETSKNAH